MSEEQIQVKAVPVEEIIDLRHRILRAGLERQEACFDGDDAPGTVHFAAYQRGKVIGCATVMINLWENQRACQLRGMAVEANLRKSGVGRLLLAEAEKYAAGAGFPLIWANCRTPASGFYKRLGWQAVSEEFEIPTAGPHYKMIKRI